MSNTPIKNRYEFVMLFDVKDGNPNGDPDAGNLPRIDGETGHGLVTDVSLKRKIRNFVTIAKKYTRPFDIYVKEKAVLGRSHYEAFQALGFATGTEVKKNISEEEYEVFQSLVLPDGIETMKGNDTYQIIVSPTIDKTIVKEWMKENSSEIKPVKKVIDGALKESKTIKPSSDEVDAGRNWLCENFYDIRTFGAVLSLKTAPNCGQVRGPVQITFARSVTPIVASEHAITRMAVATEAEAEKQHGGNRTMGRKSTVPYGLYRAHGFISAHLAEQTKFGEEDLELLWQSLEQMFDHDHSAARGEMNMRKLIVFKHESALGNAPAHKLFDRVEVHAKEPSVPAREFGDFEITINRDNFPVNVELIEKI